jgi:hypothetical protein
MIAPSLYDLRQAAVALTVRLFHYLLFVVDLFILATVSFFGSLQTGSFDV